MVIFFCPLPYHVTKWEGGYGYDLFNARHLFWVFIGCLVSCRAPLPIGTEGLDHTRPKTAMGKFKRQLAGYALPQAEKIKKEAPMIWRCFYWEGERIGRKNRGTSTRIFSPEAGARPLC